jgi:hypothetical protein
LDTPTFNRSGTAWIKGYTLYWLYDPNDSDGASALDSLVEPNAIIADDKNFTIFGDRKYCTANIREDQGPDVSHSLIPVLKIFIEFHF